MAAIKKLKAFLSHSKTQELALLTALFVFSMVIRRIAAKHGFPFLTHPDEGAILNPVFHMTRNGTLNSGFFNRPNQILYYLNFIYLNGVSYLLYGQNLAATFSRNLLTFHFYGRLLVSGFGALIPVLAYKIGKEFKQNFAISAGLVFAFFPFYTEQSLYITPDIPITLFTLLVIFFTLRYLNRGDEKWIYLAVFFSAVNTAEKYPGIISLSIVFLGVLIKFLENPNFTIQRSWMKVVKQWILLLLLFVVALFLVAPYLFIEFNMVREAITREAQATHLGADYLNWGGKLLFYMQTFAVWSNFLAVLWIGFGVYALVKWRDQHALVLLYGLLYWAIISGLPLHWDRWSLPMLITPLFLIAIGIAYFWRLINTDSKARVLAVIILLYLAQQFIATLQTSVAMTFTDTRVAASTYCEDHGIVPENTIYEGYTPFLPHRPKHIDQRDLDDHEDAEFIILSSEIYDRYYFEPDRYAEKIAFYESIKRDHPLIQEIEPAPAATNTFERLDDILYYIKNRLELAPEPRFKGPTLQIYQIVN